MKTIMIMLAVFMGTNAVAAEYKCVKVKKKHKPAQVKVIEKTVVVEKPVYKNIAVIRTVVKRKMNLVQISAGVGPNGIDASRQGNTVTAEQQYGLVGGLGYSRRLGEDSDLLLGVQGLTNKTGLVSVGVEF